MKRILIMMIMVIGLSSFTTQVRIDKELEKYYTNSIEDLTNKGFDASGKIGVQIKFIAKPSERQHKYGIAFAIHSEEYSLIRVYEKNWNDIDYWQKRWVMTHELLHTFGYEHSNNTNSLMFWDIPENVTPRMYYTALDIALSEK